QVNLGGGSGTGTAGLQGDVFVTNIGGSSGLTALTVDDAANPFAVNATLTVTGIFGLFGVVSGLGDPTSPFTLPFTNSAVSSLTLNGSSHNNTYNVQDSNIPVTLHTGGGNDTINVGSVANTLDDIHGPLTVDGQGGFDTLNVNDQNEVT